MKKKGKKSSEDTRLSKNSVKEHLNADAPLRKDLFYMYGLVLMEKYGVEGIRKRDAMTMFNLLESDEAYPIELSALERECVAMGFISPKAAEVIEYDYVASGLRDFIASALDNYATQRNNKLNFKGIKILLMGDTR